MKKIDPIFDSILKNYVNDPRFDCISPENAFLFLYDNKQDILLNKGWTIFLEYRNHLLYYILEDAEQAFKLATLIDKEYSYETWKAVKDSEWEFPYLQAFLVNKENEL